MRVTSRGDRYNISVPTKEFTMHIITTTGFTVKFEAAKISNALAFIKYLRAEGIEYTHIFED